MEGHGDGRSGRRSGGGPRPRRAGPPFRALVHYLVVPARSAYQMLRTRCLVKGRWPKARGDRESEYEREALILSSPLGASLASFWASRKKLAARRRRNYLCESRKSLTDAAKSHTIKD